MIYFKRFLFGVVTLCSIFFGVIGTTILFATAPIWGFIYYIITGNNAVDTDFEFSCLKYIMKFMDWCELKLIKNDKR